MRALLAVLSLLFVAESAAAISQYNPTRMSCGDVKAAVNKEGQVRLRWQSTQVPGLPVYDRYVSNSMYCRSDQTARISPVPTKDNKSCGVRKCVQAWDFFD